ncbi:hypothetical protein QBC44DRAFT_375470 [Cladorrhinum sp. PSN332]|nr:hypothetical protein QBC44DRAFT_375470 [Cladorrhinum sp. PSN332]
MQLLIQAILEVVTLTAVIHASQLCDNYSYENQISAGSPSVKMCNEINIELGDERTWRIGMTQRQLISYDDCKIGARRLHPGYSEIGNEDLRQVLDNSIATMAQTINGALLVGTKGWMHCGTDTVKADEDIVEWGIY